MLKRKVMIVGEDKKHLEELKETLTFSGYDTIVTQDPFSVPAIVSREQPHVILLDLKMKSKSGFQVAHELKSMPKLQDIPIIAMTKTLRYGYAELMEMSGINKCLKTPFNPLDVITEIEAALV